MFNLTRGEDIIINRQFVQLGSPEIFTHLLLAQNTLPFYLVIFLDKLYKLIDECDSL